MSICIGYYHFGKTDLANESEQVACNVPLRKSGPSVYEEVLPFPFESSVIRRIPECGVVFYNHVLSKVGF